MTNARAPRGWRSADLTGVVPHQLVGDHRSTFESYVSTAITKFGVPGAAVAVIQGGEVSYLIGFGVKELGGAEPVTPDTRLMIGSITKPMTTMLAAALIDDGRLSWDTRIAARGGPVGRTATCISHGTARRPIFGAPSRRAVVDRAGNGAFRPNRAGQRRCPERQTRGLRSITDSAG
jgi:CubicO group peptidase (beta-lactamase class C family)